MTTLGIECGHCATTVDIPVGSALLDLDSGDTQADVAGTVSWICDTCEDVATQPVTWRTLLLLVTVGAHLFDEDDERPTHPEAPPVGPPLTVDDLLDIHTLLDDPVWFAQLEPAPGLPPTASTS